MLPNKSCPSGPKSDNVDMTVPSNYSAAPSGDLCTPLMRFFDAVRWENRKSVRTRADRPPTDTAIGSPCLASANTAQFASIGNEILSATRDEMKRGGLHDAASQSRTVLLTGFLPAGHSQRVFHPWKQKVMSNTAVAGRVAGATVHVSSVAGPSATRHLHPNGPARNSFFT